MTGAQRERRGGLPTGHHETPIVSVPMEDADVQAESRGSPLRPGRTRFISPAHSFPSAMRDTRPGYFRGELASFEQR